MTSPKKQNSRTLLFWIKVFLSPLIFLVFSFIIALIWIHFLPHPIGPEINTHNTTPLIQQDDSTWTWKTNWYRKSASGHHVVYVEGDPIEMGIGQGILTQHLIAHQEEAFTQEIKRLIPSEKYLSFLQHFVKVLNKNLEDNVLPIYQQEIKAIAEYADPSFEWIGPNYARILNYHAAHDIGHALQNYMLVGCTSLSFWDSDAPQKDLWVARNFDFYVGDDFAKEKIILIARPDQGNSFISVTWGGFIGVVSGMNEHGLSVTINAAPSEIPFKAATPVSLVAREVLQFASTIKEAYEIIAKRNMFVSETFLIGSSKDHQTSIIEKTPSQTTLITPQENSITCTNHFQSEALYAKNSSSLKLDATWFRSERTQQLMNEVQEINPEELAAILRNPWGLNDINNGLGNEKNINQFIAHHSVIMNNTQKDFWVSTGPWQIGAFQYYNLSDILQNGIQSLNQSFTFQIPEANWSQDADIQNFIKFYDLKQRWTHKTWAPESLKEIEAFISLNPHFFYTLELAGNMSEKIGQKSKALEYYQRALSLDIANQDERKRIEKKLKLLSQ